MVSTGRRHARLDCTVALRTSCTSRCSGGSSMTWARLDDSFYRNRKVRGLSDKEFRFYVNALSYCADQLTDGELDHEAIGEVGRVSGISRPLRIVQELLAKGMVSGRATGRKPCVSIPDYGDYNPTKAEVIA